MNNFIEKTDGIKSTLSKNIDLVFDLMKFGDDFQEICISGLKESINILEKQGIPEGRSDYIAVRNKLTAVQKIQQNKSLTSHYQKMFNQCVVLLVAYFAYALEDIFITTLSEKFCNYSDTLKNKVQKEKISFADLLEAGTETELSYDKIAELFVKNNNDISFQDMKSVAREAEKYFDIKIEQDKDTHNIILAQACRHVLVHSNGVANKKTIRQIKEAKPRTIKTQLKEGDEINFDKDEINIIAESMKNYFNILSDKIHESFTPPETEDVINNDIPF